MRKASAKMNVVTAADSGELAAEALKLFVSDAREAIQARQRFCAAISCHIPTSFLELLGGQRLSKTLPWDKIHLFLVDQWCGVPRSSPGPVDNNYNLASSSFVPQVGIGDENVHSICSGNRNCGFVASIYEQTIYNVVRPGRNGIPRFDLIVLRMYADGHIASLFPDTYAFFDTKDLVQAIYFMDSRHTRITLTNPVLCAAFHIIVLVFGEVKASMFRQVLTGEPDRVQYPIHAIWPALGRVTWLVERSAAGLLRRRLLMERVKDDSAGN